MVEKYYGKADLMIFDTREEMGKKAAKDAEETIVSLLKSKKEINCIFAAAPSQNDFLGNIIQSKKIDWTRINAYHMDEYVGLQICQEGSFTKFLTDSIFSKVPFKSVNLINGGAADVNEEVERYSFLLDSIDVDITFMGIGENGHIAFNDPGVADFNDSKTVKIVKLDSVCREQQVHDKCFPNINSVPENAFTVTIPKLISSKYIFCIVPTEKKRTATKLALTGPISEDCPASILRTKDNSRIYIDRDCAGDLME